MTDHFKNLERLDAENDKADPAKRLAGIQRTLARIQEIDPANVEGILFAVKMHDRPDGSSDFQVGTVGSVNLMLGMVENLVANLEENLPGFKERLDLQEAIEEFKHLLGEADDPMSPDKPM